MSESKSNETATAPVPIPQIIDQDEPSNSIDKQRYPISPRELPQALAFARVTATKSLASSKGRALLKDMATSMHCSIDDAQQTFLTRVQRGVVERAQIANMDPKKPEITLEKMLASDYTHMSLPRRQAAAAAAAKAAECYAESYPETAGIHAGRNSSTVATTAPVHTRLKRSANLSVDAVQLLTIDPFEVRSSAKDSVASIGTEHDYEWATSIDFLPPPERAKSNTSPPTTKPLQRIESYEWNETGSP